MPTTTRRQHRLKAQQEPPPCEDTIADCITMYPVFCTAHIPSKILDEFIDEAYRGWIDMVGDPSMSHPAPCILQTTDLDSIAHGSRKPMPADFKSPFLNKTDNEIREWVLEHCHNRQLFAQTTFTIFDQNTAERKISRIGYVNSVRPDNRMLWTDFFTDLRIRVPVEMCTLGWENLMSMTQPGEILNQKAIHEQSLKAEKKLMNERKAQEG